MDHTHAVFNKSHGRGERCFMVGGKKKEKRLIFGTPHLRKPAFVKRLEGKVPRLRGEEKRSSSEEKKSRTAFLKGIPKNFGLHPGEKHSFLLKTRESRGGGICFLLWKKSLQQADSRTADIPQEKGFSSSARPKETANRPQVMALMQKKGVRASLQLGKKAGRLNADSPEEGRRKKILCLIVRLGQKTNLA